MDWIAPISAIAAAAITAVGAGILSRLRLSDRLRQRAQAELDILAKLPPGTDAHTFLTDHVNRTVLRLVAEEEPYSSWERMDRRWGYVLTALGVALGASLIARPLPLAVTVVGVTPCVALALYGQWRLTRSARAREYRRHMWRAIADRRTPSPPTPSVRSTLRALLRSLVVWSPSQRTGQSNQDRPSDSGRPGSEAQ